MYCARVDQPLLKRQEIPFDSPESNNFFEPGPAKPFVVTPGAIEATKKDPKDARTDGVNNDSTSDGVAMMPNIADERPRDTAT